MIALIKRLIDAGYDVYYDIYGEGPFQPKIEAEIARCGLQGRVSLKGHLAYENFPQALETAYCFVGMGTAAIEAAAAAVPTVYSPPRDLSGVTHGLMHRFDVLELGGFAQKSNPTQKVYDILCELFQMDERNYNIECAASAKAMDRYSIDAVMSHYENLFTKDFSERRGCIGWKRTSFLTFCNFILVIRQMRRFLKKSF